MESLENGHGVNVREAIERTGVLSISRDLTKISCWNIHRGHGVRESPWSNKGKEALSRKRDSLPRAECSCVQRNESIDHFWCCQAFGISLPRARERYSPRLGSTGAGWWGDFCFPWCQPLAGIPIIPQEAVWTRYASIDHASSRPSEVSVLFL